MLLWCSSSKNNNCKVLGESRMGSRRFTLNFFVRQDSFREFELGRGLEGEEKDRRGENAHHNLAASRGRQYNSFSSLLSFLM